MHELSIYDTRTVESSQFEPWMVGRPVTVMVVYDDNNKWGIQIFGVLEYIAMDAHTWVVKVEGRPEQDVPRSKDQRSRHLIISVVIPANYMHIRADGSRVGEFDDD